MTLHLLNILLSAYNQPCLGGAKELVPAERKHIRSCFLCMQDIRLFDPVPLQPLKQSASHIIDQRNPVFTCKPGEFLQGCLLCKTDNPVIAGVCLKESAGLLVQLAFVIRKTCAVCRPYLAEDGSALLTDVRNPEGSADLDQLPAGNQNLLAAGKCRQRKKNSGRIIVDHHGVLCPAEFPQNLRHMIMARPSASGVQTVFQIRVASGCSLHRLQRPVGQGRPSQVCVKDDAGSVYHRPERISGIFFQSALGSLQNRFHIRQIVFFP